MHSRSEAEAVLRAGWRRAAAERYGGERGTRGPPATIGLSRIRSDGVAETIAELVPVLRLSRGTLNPVMAGRRRPSAALAYALTTHLTPDLGHVFDAWLLEMPSSGPTAGILDQAAAQVLLDEARMYAAQDRWRESRSNALVVAQMAASAAGTDGRRLRSLEAQALHLIAASAMPLGHALTRPGRWTALVLAKRAADIASEYELTQLEDDALETLFLLACHDPDRSALSQGFPKRLFDQLMARADQRHDRQRQSLLVLRRGQDITRRQSHGEAIPVLQAAVELAEDSAYEFGYACAGKDLAVAFAWAGKTQRALATLSAARSVVHGVAGLLPIRVDVAELEVLVALKEREAATRLFNAVRPRARLGGFLHQLDKARKVLGEADWA